MGIIQSGSLQAQHLSVSTAAMGSLISCHGGRGEAGRSRADTKCSIDGCRMSPVGNLRGRQGCWGKLLPQRPLDFEVLEFCLIPSVDWLAFLVLFNQ